MQASMEVTAFFSDGVCSPSAKPVAGEGADENKSLTPIFGDALVNVKKVSLPAEVLRCGMLAGESANNDDGEERDSAFLAP